MAHTHAHSHGHSHDHGHHHAPADFGRAFLIGTLLNTAFVLVEGGYGFASGSMALLADAGHNLSDVLGLILAWSGSALARQAPTRRYTYGFRKSSILAALLNAMFLLAAIGGIILAAFQRLYEPEPVSGGTMAAVAALGIAVNAVTALMFASGRKSDINIRGAFLHMAADAAVSAGVVIAGLLILRTGAAWIDPAVSLVIALIILIGTWSLFREALSMSLDAVPPDIDPLAVEAALARLDGVVRVHDLHIWPMSTTEIALTCHLMIPAERPADAFLHQAADMLHHRFKIAHTTLQIERGDEADCRQAPGCAP